MDRWMDSKQKILCFSKSYVSVMQSTKFLNNRPSTLVPTCLNERTWHSWQLDTALLASGWPSVPLIKAKTIQSLVK